MIKMTIVTDERGELAGAVTGHSLSAKHGEVEARVSFPKSYRLHKVEVGDDLDMAQATDAISYQERLLKYVPKP